MTLDPWLRWLEETGIASTISENEFLFPWIEALHVLAITTVVGLIFIVDLRLLGLASRDRPASRLLSELLPLTWAAFALAVVTGTLMFIAKAVSYGHNTFFLVKLSLLAIAGLNMMVFHRWTGSRVQEWTLHARPPLTARVAGGLSITLWILIVACGRWIGFTLR